MKTDLIDSIKSLTKKSRVRLTVHGETDIYVLYKDSDGSWDLKVADKCGVLYGFSCSTFSELKVLLAEDVQAGIITELELV